MRFLRDFDFKSRDAFRLADRFCRGGISAATVPMTPHAAIEAATPDCCEAAGNQGVLNR